MIKQVRKSIFLGIPIGVCLLLGFCWFLIGNNVSTLNGDASAMYKGTLVSDWVKSIEVPNLQMNPQIATVVEIGEPAIPFLIERLQDPSSILTRSVSYKWVWNRVPQVVQQSLPRPAKNRNDRERVIRAVAYTLRKMNGVANDAIQPLMNIAEDQSLTMMTREYALQALWHMGSEGQIIIPNLIDCLKDSVERIQILPEDGTTRSKELSLCTSMVHTLARIGGDYTAVEPHLRLLSTNPDPKLMACSVVSLWRLKATKEYQERIISLLELSDEKVCRYTITYLGNIGPSAAEFLPYLVSIEKESKILSGVAKHAVSKIGFMEFEKHLNQNINDALDNTP